MSPLQYCSDANFGRHYSILVTLCIVRNAPLKYYNQDYDCVVCGFISTTFYIGATCTLYSRLSLSNAGSWASQKKHWARTLHNTVKVQGTEEIVLLIRSSTEPALFKSAAWLSRTISSVPWTSTVLCRVGALYVFFEAQYPAFDIELLLYWGFCHCMSVYCMQMAHSISFVITLSLTSHWLWA